MIRSNHESIVTALGCDRARWQPATTCLGQTIAKGLDAAINYDWDLAGGQLSAGFNGSYFTKLTTSQAPGAPQVDVLNTLNVPQRFRGRAELGWRRNEFSAVTFVNYVSSYEPVGVAVPRGIDAYKTVDLPTPKTTAAPSAKSPLHGSSGNCSAITRLPAKECSSANAAHSA
jgi:hypothetical protein